MDIKTAILALSAGNCVFGVVLLLFQSGEKQLPSNRYWTAAKFLQSFGWLLLFSRAAILDSLIMTVAYISLLFGFAYECWAMCRISGRSVSGTTEAYSLLIVFICGAFVPLMTPALVVAVTSCLSSLFFFFSGGALLNAVGRRSILRIYVGWSSWLLATILCARGVLALAAPQGFSLFSDNTIQLIAFTALYYFMLTGGFGVLLLARQTTDQDLQEALKEQEAILNTLPTGLCIVRERIIERCNPAIERIFGFAPGTMIGKSVRSLFENEAVYTEYGSKIYRQIDEKGVFAGEVPYVRKNGERFWAWDQGTVIFPERSRAWAVFSITDITEQKKQLEMIAQQKAKVEKTSARLKSLEGIIAICMYCKKIRNEKQSWEQLENYLIENTDAMFSHGLCPECAEKEYGRVQS
jgi:PAS domain S-box-containing protein